MSQFEKLLNRFKSFPKDFTYDELKALLKHLGFTEMKRGKTNARYSFILGILSNSTNSARIIFSLRFHFFQHTF